MSEAPEEVCRTDGKNRTGKSLNKTRKRKVRKGEGRGRKKTWGRDKESTEYR